VHGVYFQTPEVHLRPSGCPKCAKLLRLDNQKAISVKKVAEKILRASHGEVSINEESFSNINSKATFGCKRHGSYKRLVNVAINSEHPCLSCLKEIRENAVIEIKSVDAKIFEKFGNNYSFEVIPGKNLRSTRILLTCAQHGDFSISYSSLARSPGCPACSRDRSQSARTAGLKTKTLETLKLRTDRWISRASLAHNNKYDYGEVVYVDAKTPVAIICPIHGKFDQIPDTHLKSGCRACADQELLGKYSEKYFMDNPEQASKISTLYYIQLSSEDEVFYKVGITTTTIKNRFGMTKAGGVKVEVLQAAKLSLIDAFRTEQLIQQLHGTKFRYRPKLGGKSVRSLRIGPSECFSSQLPLEILSRYFNASPESSPLK
jgi:hypothetical protein